MAKETKAGRGIVESMISIKDKQRCCGCGACASACPRRCITMEADEEGFLYPKVDTVSCIDCGLCEKVCPFLSEEKAEIPPFHTFAAKNYDDDVRAVSSSGGLFSLFAEKMIEEGGVVFGAQFDENWNVVHGSATTIEELPKFRGSKYVQSLIGDSFVRTKEFLKQGKKVLFSGTSCQIMGLKRYLGRDYPNLFTIDVICHGVPSPAVWKKYLDEIVEVARKGNKNQFRSLFTSVIPETDTIPAPGTLEGISFRDKTFGWRKSSFALYFAKAAAAGEKKQFRSLIANDYRSKYFVAFNNNLTIRHSCFNCPAKGGRCGSDITLADFWSIEKELPDFSDDKGISICMCNTEKGINVFNALKMDKREVSYTQAVSHNRAWRISLPPHPKREKFFKLFAKNGRVLPNIDRCLEQPVWQKYVNSIKIRIKRIFSISK